MTQHRGPTQTYRNLQAEVSRLREGIAKIVKVCRPCVSTREDGCTGCHIVEELELLLAGSEQHKSTDNTEKHGT